MMDEASIHQTLASAMLPTEEYIEQTYFFRTLRERIREDLPAQDVLSQTHDEILSTTRLPLAIQFLAGELKMHGAMAPAMGRLSHYFTAWQAFVISRAEDEHARFDIATALHVLEREAEYKAKQATAAGLFAYQFEALSRNRLGYDEGLRCAADDPFYDEAWRKWILQLRGLLGHMDFGDLVYLSSEYHRTQRRRLAAGEEGSDSPSRFPILFGEKEGKIAWANRGKEPLYLFAALQRQLGYPAVPRLERHEELNLIPRLQRQIHQLETRVKLLESEMKGTLDLSQFYVKPDEAADAIAAGTAPSPTGL